MKPHLLLALLLYQTGGFTAPWKAFLPAIATKPSAWQSLVSELMDRKFYYGAFAASQRILVFYPDLEMKETAYRTIINLVELGYPNSTRHLFLSGDIEPDSSESFSTAYYLYKGIIHEEMKIQKWASVYLAKVDAKKFPKSLFYQALQRYKANDIKGAETLLITILDGNLEMKDQSLAKKVARMLARIFFERKEYKKSWEIYYEFLLRVNPVTPSDYLEGAWNLYYLKRYSEAVGLLYNLEAASASKSILLETYVIRAISYKHLCATEAMKELVNTFNERFGDIIVAVKRGQSAPKSEVLSKIATAESRELQELLHSLTELMAEREALRNISSVPNPLLDYLYDSEIEMLEYTTRVYRYEAMDRAVREIILHAENLRFLEFEVVREKFNPDVVFSNGNQTTKKTPEVLPLEVRWTQRREFWRDERLRYKAELPNLCGN